MIIKLITKIIIGLFTNPIPSPTNPNIQTVGSIHDRLLSKSVALESITLLKNEGPILPLPLNGSLKKILVTGNASNSLSVQNGGYSLIYLLILFYFYFPN